MFSIQSAAPGAQAAFSTHCWPSPSPPQPFHMMKDEWIREALGRDFVMVASDGMPYAPGAHPRSAGTFSRFLGRYVRDEGLMPLMDGLAPCRESTT